MPGFNDRKIPMASPSSVAIHTLGCKLNFSESSALRQRFEQRGFAVHPFDEAADIYVINTCSVTEFADRKMPGCGSQSSPTKPWRKNRCDRMLCPIETSRDRQHRRG